MFACQNTKRSLTGIVGWYLHDMSLDKTYLIYFGTNLTIPMHAIIIKSKELEVTALNGKGREIRDKENYGRPHSTP